MKKFFCGFALLLLPLLAPGTFVAALFPADPVLQRQFATNAVTRAQLQAAVHAYNTGVRLPR